MEGKLTEKREVAGKTVVDKDPYDVEYAEAHSGVNLEDDRGEGGAAIIRRFEFGVNPQAFAEHQPTTQDLFNAHLKGIEIALWRDGLQPMTEIEPRLLFSKDKTRYAIFVGAVPAKGHLLHEKPQTLSEVLHS